MLYQIGSMNGAEIRSVTRLNSSDIEAWVVMFTDPRVMEYVGSAGAMSRNDARKAFEHHRQLFDTKGYGWWAIDVKGGPSFAGVIVLEDFGLSSLVGRNAPDGRIAIIDEPHLSIFMVASSPPGEPAKAS